MNHEWTHSNVKNFSTSRTSPGNKPPRRNRRKISDERLGYMCARCRLVALPKSTGEFTAPKGKCEG